MGHKAANASDSGEDTSGDDQRKGFQGQDKIQRDWNRYKKRARSEIQRSAGGWGALVRQGRGRRVGGGPTEKEVLLKCPVTENLNLLLRHKYAILPPTVAPRSKHADPIIVFLEGPNMPSYPFPGSVLMTRTCQGFVPGVTPPLLWEGVTGGGHPHPQ